LLNEASRDSGHIGTTIEEPLAGLKQFVAIQRTSHADVENGRRRVPFIASVRVT